MPPNQLPPISTRKFALVCLTLLGLIGILSDHRFVSEPPQSTMPGGKNPIPTDPLPRSDSWSTVRPPTHGTNPIPEGFVLQASFEEVSQLSFPSPGPVGQGLRARVLLGEMPDASTPRHRYVRIEEIASIEDNTLIERRVMPADHVVVFLQDGKTEADLRQALPEGYKVRRTLLGARRCLVSFDGSKADALAQAIQTMQRLATVAVGASADGYVFPSAVPNDPLFTQQWGLHNTGQAVNGLAGTVNADIDATEAWDQTTGSSAVTVAVIDSGIDLTHGDLVDNIWVNPGESGNGKETNGIDDDGNGLIDDVHGWDFVNDDNVPADDFGHGTHVAGIIGAKGDNGIGMAGVCWNVSLVAIKALRSNGSGLWSDVQDAVTYASRNHLNIGNLSLGAYGSAPIGVQLTFEQADDVLFCVAAGNGSLAAGGTREGDNIDEIPFVPAALELGHILTVAALTQDGQLAPFSNFGPSKVDVGAPGTAILSTKRGGGYELKSGTSMACAYVSGMAALYVQARREADIAGAPPLAPHPADIRSTLQICVKRQPVRLTDRCATEGSINASRVTMQGKALSRWRHLSARAPRMAPFEAPSTAEGDFNALGGFRQILPKGGVTGWGSGIAVPQSIPLGQDMLSLPAHVKCDLMIDMDLHVWAPATMVLPGHNGAITGPHYRYSQLENVVDVFSDNNVHLFLTTSGQLYSAGMDANAFTGRHAYGDAANASLGLISLPAPVRWIGGGTEAYFALLANGTVWAWGSNNGELGLGHIELVSLPTQVTGLPYIHAMFASSFGAFAIAAGDQVWGWSARERWLAAKNKNTGGLGNGTLADVIAPVRIPAWDGARFFAMGEGDGMTVAVHRDGRVLASGGDPVFWNAASAITVPLVVPGITDAALAAMVSDYSETLVVTRRGNVVQLGTTPYRSFVGSGLKTLSPLASELPNQGLLWELAVGYEKDLAGSDFCALEVENRSHSWGDNTRGGTGTGVASSYSKPVEIPSLRGCTAVAADSMATTAAMNSGRISLWGRIIRNGLVDYGVEVEYPNLMNVTRITFSSQNKYDGTDPALLLPDQFATRDAQGHVFIHPSSGSDLTPWQVSGISNAIDLAAPAIAERQNTMGILTSDGHVWAMDFPAITGRPVQDITGTAGNASPFIAIAPGAFPAAAQAGAVMLDRRIYLLKANGTVWSYRATGPVATGATLASSSLDYRQVSGLTNVTAIVGSGFLAALRSDGSVWRVYEYPGFPSYAQELIGFSQLGQSPVVKLAAGYTHLLALRADGTITSYGYDVYGQLGTGALNTEDLVARPVYGISDAVEIFASEFQSYVRRADGSMFGWGRNSDGQLLRESRVFDSQRTLAYGVSNQVQNSGTDLSDWLTTYFSRAELGSINISGDEADPDRDGLTNLMEYALGSDPKVASDLQGEAVGLTASFETVSSEGLSADGTGTATGERHFTVKLKRRAKRPGIEYRIEFSDDMEHWTASTSRLIKVLESEKVLIYRDVDPLGVAAHRWARLVIRKGN